MGLISRVSSRTYRQKSMSEFKKFFENDTLLPFSQSSIHPDLINSDTPVALGIDEAGRGPVLGPMVYACCFTPLDHHEAIRDQGCIDSKQLKDSDRRQILRKINKLTKVGESLEASEPEEEELPKSQKTKNAKKVKAKVKTESEKDEEDEKPKILPKLGWILQVLPPSYLSMNQLAPAKYNLNELSHDAATFLITKAIQAGIKVASVFVDTVGPPEKYQQKLASRFPDIKFTVEKKADDTYPSVSAASIVAKVCRDTLVENWEHKEPHIDNTKKCGSGYPGDDVTKKWLRSHFDPVFRFPQFVRFSWSTASKIIEDDGVQLDFPEDEEDDQQKSKKRKKHNVDIFKPKRAAIYRNSKLER